MDMPDHATLGEAREALRKLFADGTRCPLCRQFVMRYKRTITSPSAYGLILFYWYFRRHDHDPWLHAQNYFAECKARAARGGDFSKLRHWGLIKPMRGERADGSKRVGFYAITDLGNAFVERRIKIPKSVFIYNGEALKGPEEADLISIDDALGTKFDYNRLMGIETEKLAAT